MQIFSVASLLASIVIACIVLYTFKPLEKAENLQQKCNESMVECKLEENLQFKYESDQSVLYNVKLYFRSLGVKLKSSYTNSFIVQWSLWWALSQAGMLQVSNYAQNLWALSQTNEQNVYNGLAQACTTLTSEHVCY